MNAIIAILCFAGFIYLVAKLGQRTEKLNQDTIDANKPNK